MAQYIESLRQFFRIVITSELIKLRHDAIKLGDTEIKKIIDEEIKRRDHE